MIAVLTVEGVLSEPTDDLNKAGPSSFGKALYGSIRGTGSLGIILLSADRDEVRVSNWLAREGFSGYSLLMTAKDSLLEGVEYKVDAVKRLLAGGHFVSYVVDSDPEMVRPMVSVYGVPCLLAVSAMSKAGKSIDLPYQPWDSVVTVLHEEALERAKLKEGDHHG